MTTKPKKKRVARKGAGAAEGGSGVARGRIVVAVGTLALAAVAYFLIVRGSGETPSTLPAVHLPVNDGYAMICRGCKNHFAMKRAEMDAWPMVDGTYKCPKCGSNKTEPDNSKITPMVEVPPGG